MRGIKAALLLALVALIGWAPLVQGQMAATLWPDYKLSILGGIVACIYCLADTFDRSREWMGWRAGGSRRRYYGWGRRYE